MANKGGPTKAAYDKAYGARPEQVKKRAQRNAARREYEKANGPLPGSTDVDHRKPIDAGGTNAKENLAATSQTANRGWRRGATKANPKGYGK